MSQQLEELILEAARTDDNKLDELLLVASETMEEAQFYLLCDKVTQIMSEDLHELRNWKDIEVTQ